MLSPSNPPSKRFKSNTAINAITFRSLQLKRDNKRHCRLTASNQTPRICDDYKITPVGEKNQMFLYSWWHSFACFCPHRRDKMEFKPQFETKFIRSFDTKRPQSFQTWHSIECKFNNFEKLKINKQKINKNLVNFER